MPRVRPDDYVEFDDENSFEVADDEPVNRRGQRVIPSRIPCEDRDWEESRKQSILRRYRYSE